MSSIRNSGAGVPLARLLSVRLVTLVVAALAAMTLSPAPSNAAPGAVKAAAAACSVTVNIPVSAIDRAVGGRSGAQTAREVLGSGDGDSRSQVDVRLVGDQIRSTATADCTGFAGPNSARAAVAVDYAPFVRYAVSGAIGLAVRITVQNLLTVYGGPLAFPVARAAGEFAGGWTLGAVYAYLNGNYFDERFFAQSFGGGLVAALGGEFSRSSNAVTLRGLPNQMASVATAVAGNTAGAAAADAVAAEFQSARSAFSNEWDRITGP